MNSTSKTRRAQLAQYRRDRREFLAVRPWCEAHLYRLGSSRKPDGALIMAVDIHHREGRMGIKLLDQSKWMPVCRVCHDWIGRYPAKAREYGLIGPLGSWNTTDRTKHAAK